MSHPLELTQLYKAEEAAATEFGPSSTPADIAYQILGFPENPSGLVVAELASGATGLVELLLQKGAKPYAVDAAYFDSLEVIKQKATDILDQQSSYAPLGFGRTMYALGAQSIAEFVESYQRNPQRYIAGYLTRLSLPNDFADWTTSLNGLSTLWEDPQITLTALKEAHRITKPGGRIVLSPIHLGHSYEEYLASEHAQVIAEINQLGLGRVEIEEGIAPNAPIPTGTWNRLTIFKSPLT